MMYELRTFKTRIEKIDLVTVRTKVLEKVGVPQTFAECKKLRKEKYRGALIFPVHKIRD